MKDTYSYLCNFYNTNGYIISFTVEIAASRVQQGDVQDTQRLIEIPALGRRVELGMLYDKRNDKVKTDKKLSKRYIKSMSIKDKTFDRNVTIFQAHEDNLITQALSISNSLATSISIGLVKVSGAAEYIDNKNVSDNEARVILHLSSTVKRKELRPETTLPRKDRIFFANGTHLVTGVRYGIQAFFVFSQEPKENEIKSHVQSKLVELVSRLKTCIPVERGKTLQFNRNEAYNEIQCQFYGDISSTCIKAAPRNFNEALDYMTKLMRKTKKKLFCFHSCLNLGLHLMAAVQYISHLNPVFIPSFKKRYRVWNVLRVSVKICSMTYFGTTFLDSLKK